jgi:hypothetical protein
MIMIDESELAELRRRPDDETQAHVLRILWGLQEENERLRKESLAGFLARKLQWSLATFGEGPHTAGIQAHIVKELAEISANPSDYKEWIDVLFLALDGYLRHGGRPENLLPDLEEKLAINKKRKWPEFHPDDLAIEHIREGVGD